MASFVVAFPTLFSFSLQRLCKTFLLLRINERDVAVNAHVSSEKTLTDVRTDMTKLRVAFRHFANTFKTYFLVE